MRVLSAYLEEQAYLATCETFQTNGVQKVYALHCNLSLTALNIIKCQQLALYFFHIFFVSDTNERTSTVICVILVSYSVFESRKSVRRLTRHDTADLLECRGQL